MKFAETSAVAIVALAAVLLSMRAQQEPSRAADAQAPAAQQQSPAKQTQQQLATDEWIDDFDKETLDAAKWQRFSIEGGPINRVELHSGMLKLRGNSGTRAGLRSVPMFVGDRFIVEAKLDSVSPQMPEPGQPGRPNGFANLTVLFDGDGRNRLEWVLRSDGRFEAWSVVDFRGQRLDSNNLGTREAHPTLAIARRGDDFLFVLNGQVGLTKTLPNMPKRFAVFLYGFGTSETTWDYARVVTTK